MTLSKVQLGITAFIVFMLALVGGATWLQEHNARLKAETTTAVQQKTIDQAKGDAKQAAEVVKQTAGQLKLTLAALEAEKAKPATAQQIVIDASKLFPNLPAPLQVVTPPPTTETVDGKTVEVPSEPVVQIPQVDFKALQDGAITCQENAASLSACQLTAAQVQIELADVQVELKTTTAQRDEWEKAAKGGTWLHRTVTAVKWVAIGGAVGYVAGHKF
jgi:endonuclease YncB( thermonuclease family)